MGVIQACWCRAVTKIDALIEGGKTSFNKSDIIQIASSCGLSHEEVNNLANYSAQALRGVYG